MEDAVATLEKSVIFVSVMMLKTRDLHCIDHMYTILIHTFCKQWLNVTVVYSHCILSEKTRIDWGVVGNGNRASKDKHRFHLPK